MNILIVDDSAAIRKILQRVLGQANVPISQVFEAGDGVQALEVLKSNPIGLVLSDINMPNMDGLLLTARIRQDPNYREVPVILVTSLASEEDRRRGIEVGANAYITKGDFEQKVLIDTLRRLV